MVGKSDESVLPPIYAFPPASTAIASAASWDEPPRYVEYTSDWAFDLVVSSRATKAVSFAFLGVDCSTLAVTGKSLEVVMPATKTFELGQIAIALPKSPEPVAVPPR